MNVTVERHARYGAPAGFPDERTVFISFWRQEQPLPTEAILGEAFRLGQNDFQPLPMPSVSVGDVIVASGDRFRVEPFGFTRLTVDGVPVAQVPAFRGRYGERRMPGLRAAIEKWESSQRRRDRAAVRKAERAREAS